MSKDKDPVRALLERDENRTAALVGLGQALDQLSAAQVAYQERFKQARSLGWGARELASAGFTDPTKLPKAVSRRTTAVTEDNRGVTAEATE